MTTQVSAYISNETKMIFENFSAKTGQKKGFILEQALLHYINANQELPADIIIPPSITVSKDVYENVMMADREPTQALRDLLNEDRD
jgi:excinuclease UvrABC nuclease subunit